MIDVVFAISGRYLMKPHSDYKKFSSTPIIHIGTDDVRKRMGEILDCVNLRGDEFLIERKRKALAVLIPVQKHKVLEKMAREFLSKSLIGENRKLSQKEADQLADEAKHASREKNL